MVLPDILLTDIAIHEKNNGNISDYYKILA